jgi:hypothetical protein
MHLRAEEVGEAAYLHWKMHGRVADWNKCHLVCFIVGKERGAGVGEQVNNYLASG